jgi:hypothetical protein
LVHGPDNQEIEINPKEISSIREVRGADAGHFREGAKCLIIMTNGKFISTVENCRTVTDRVQEALDKGE